MTYQEFISLVPNKTKEFVDNLLSLLYFYMNNDARTIRVDDEYISGDNSKMIVLSFYAYSLINEYNNLLVKHSYNRNETEIDYKVNKEIPMEEAFSYLYTLVNSIESKKDFCQLTPTDIILRIIKKYASNSLRAVNLMFYSNIEDIYKDLDNFNDKEKKNISKLIEKELYNDLTVSVVNYLETASKILQLLEKNSIPETSIYSKSAGDFVPLSLFLAVFYYNDAPIKDNLISEQQAIEKILKKKSITYNIKDKLGINLYQDDINLTNKNIYSMKINFYKYISELEKTPLDRKDIKVTDIFLKNLDKNFTGSFAVSKLLAQVGISVDSFTDFKQEVTDELTIKEDEKENRFYENLTKDSKDFIEFTCKVYQLILKQMDKNTHNSDILVDKDDADTLALYISNCYYKGEVNEFFLEYGVTLDKVLKLLKLDIKKEDILNTRLDTKILIERFERFISEGVNYNTKRSDVTPSKIIFNLCDKNFNKSMIMENIFEELTDKVNLEQNFTNQMRKTIKMRMLRKENRLRQRVLKDLSIDVINVLDKISSFHKAIFLKHSELSIEDIKALSVLASIIDIDANYKEFFEFLGIKEKAFLGKLDIKDLPSPSIEIIQNYYGDYIFGGFNKEKERKDITIYSLVKNIFNKDLNNSVYFRELLANNFTLEDFDKTYETFLQKQKEDNIKNTTRKYISYLDENMNILVNRSLFICDRLMTYNDNNFSKEDITNLSILLGYLYGLKDDYLTKLMLKRNLSKENILKVLNIDKNIFLNYGSIDINYLLFEDIFSKYKKENFTEPSNILKSLFENDSQILVKIAKLNNIDYDILKREILTGLPYEESLSIEERIDLLNNTKMEPLTNDYTSVLEFGNSLLLHAKYINKELPMLSHSDTHEVSIKTINEVLNRVYQKEEVKEEKKNFFQRFFSVEVEEKENKPKYVLNPDAIKELTEEIDKQIEVLYNEFREYEAMSNYIDAYRKRNNSLYNIAKEKTQEVGDKLNATNKEDDAFFGEYLKLNTLYNALSDKTNRLLMTNEIMRQNLLSLNQNMITHALTINTLKMARDDLIPLVVSQLAITKGQKTEKDGILLSQNIFSLFSSLLSRNIDGAIENMQSIKNVVNDNGIIDIINDNIKTYLEQMQIEKENDNKLFSNDNDKKLLIK